MSAIFGGEISRPEKSLLFTFLAKLAQNVLRAKLFLRKMKLLLHQHLILLLWPEMTKPSFKNIFKKCNPTHVSYYHIWCPMFFFWLVSYMQPSHFQHSLNAPGLLYLYMFPCVTVPVFPTCFTYLYIALFVGIALQT